MQRCLSPIDPKHKAESEWPFEIVPFCSRSKLHGVTLVVLVESLKDQGLDFVAISKIWGSSSIDLIKLTYNLTKITKIMTASH